MFWNKKEDKKLLPDLPPYKSPTLINTKEGHDSSTHLNDEFDEEHFSEKHELPSFPDSLNDKGFSQAAIKDAIGSDSEEDFEKTFPKNVEKFKTVEMEEWAPSIKGGESDSHRMVMEENPPIIKSTSARLEEPPSLSAFNNAEKEIFRGGGVRNNDIFVKLDKFYSARKSLVDAQQKLEDIDALLRKIREIKMREEQELNSWEKEIMDIKTRINDVALNLFEKVE